METATLILQSALFNSNAASKLSLLVSKETLWTHKLTTTFFYLGFLSNGYAAGKHAAAVFKAECLHILPVTQGGLFLYHRHRNNKIIAATLNKGLSGGFKSAAAVLGFCLIETGISYPLSQDNFMSRMAPPPLAGLTTAALFSAYNRLWWSSSSKLLLYSSIGGFAISSLQEAYFQIYGHSIKEFRH